MNNYFYISQEKEYSDTIKLCAELVKDKWVDSNTTIINCSPDYSSFLSMILNHKLSHLNKNELFPMINLEMPYPNMSQIWNETEEKYELFDSYLTKWITKNIYPSQKYLFVDSGTLRGKNFNKVKLCIREKIEKENYRFASLYMQSSSIFKPDYLVETFDFDKQGGLLFWWENVNNPNWNY